MCWVQTSANWGPDSWFVLEAIIKALIPKSSRCLILKTHNHLHLIPNSQPDLSLPIFWYELKIGQMQAQIVIANYGCVNSNTLYLTAIQRGIQP